MLAAVALSPAKPKFSHQSAFIVCRKPPFFGGWSCAQRCPGSHRSAFASMSLTIRLPCTIECAHAGGFRAATIRSLLLMLCHVIRCAAQHQLVCIQNHVDLGSSAQAGKEFSEKPGRAGQGKHEEIGAPVPTQASSSHNTSYMVHVRWKGTIPERVIGLVLGGKDRGPGQKAHPWTVLVDSSFAE